MPYSDREIRNLLRRSRDRTKKHGNWRQVVVDCNCSCVWKNPDGTVCGESECLEFHEVFGEDHKGDGRMQERILLCNKHHQDSHPLGYPVEHNPNKSRLSSDVALEIERCGGYSSWIANYMLDDSRAGCKVNISNKELIVE